MALGKAGPVTALIEFVTARLDEDEAAAKLMAKYYPPPWNVYDRGWMARVYGGDPFWEVIQLEQGPWTDNDTPPLGEIIEHVALHDPARVLREVAAKRALLADITAEKHLVVDSDPYYTCLAATEERDDGKSWGHEKGGTDCNCGLDERVEQRLRLLAAPYSDHPDYREEWAASRP